MNKLFTKIAALSVGLAMAIGVGVAVGSGNKAVRAKADVDTTFSGPSITFSDVTDIANGVKYPDWTGDEYSIKFGDGGNDGKYYTTGAGIRIYTNGYIKITPASGRTMTKIELTFSSSSSGYMPSNGSYTLSDDSSLSFNNTKATWNGSSTSAIQLTRDSGNNHWRLQSISVTSSGGGSSAKISSVSVTGAPDSIVTGVCAGSVGPTLTATATFADSGTGTPIWTWASDNESAVKVSDAGRLMYVGNGTAHITATASNYEAASGGSNVGSATVSTSSLKGLSASDPISVDEAIALMDAMGSGLVVQAEVYVTGTFSSGTTYNATYTQWEGQFAGSNSKVLVVKATNDSGVDIGTTDGNADGKECVVKGYLELFNSNYQLSYLPAAASPTHSAYTPSIVSITASLITTQQVHDLIAAIGEVAYTSESKAKIDAARTLANQYDAQDGCAYTDVDNYSTLTTAEETYEHLKDQAAADAVADLIDALPSASSITDYSHHSEIMAAKAAFEALSETQQGLVSSELVTKLQACIAKDATFTPTVDGIYSKVTALSQLTAGAVVIITNADGTVAMSTTQNTNNRGTTTGAAQADGDITIAKNSTPTIQVFTIESYNANSDTIVAFKTLNGDSQGYIYAAGTGNSNHLKTKETVDASAKFTITLTNGEFDAVAGSDNRNILRYNSSNNPPMFSCYNDAQNHIALYIKHAVNPDVVASVSVDPTSLTLGIGASSELEASIYPDTALNKNVSWSSDDTSVAEVVDGVVTGVAAGTATITVTTQDGGKTATCSVTVKEMVLGIYYKVSASSELSAGDKIIFAAPNSTHPTIAANSINNKKLDGTATSATNHWSDTFGVTTVESLRADGNSFEWTVSKDGNNFKFADSEGNYLHMAGNNTDLSFETTAGSGNSWTLEDGSAADGTFLIKNVSQTGRALSYSTAVNVFGGYATSNLDSAGSYYTVDIYKLVVLSNSDKMSGITCTGTGGYTADWTSLESTFNGLSNGVKAYYAHASYSKTGTGTETVVTATNNTDATIAQFVAKYDDIVSKHGLTDFMKRNPTPVNQGKISFATDNNSNAVTAIIVISSITLLGVGGYFFIRKKKEQ